MHTNDFLINDSTDRHAIEGITEHLPHFNAVASLAFIIEPVNSGNGCTFVISSQGEKIVRVFCFVGKHQCDGLEALLAPIHIVTQKHVIARRWKLAVLEESEKVVVLAVHISTDLQRRLKLNEGTLPQEHLAGCLAKALQLPVTHRDNPTRFATSGLQAFVDHLINAKGLLPLHHAVGLLGQARRAQAGEAEAQVAWKKLS